jgi:hypothetical protein
MSDGLFSRSRRGCFRFHFLFLCAELEPLEEPVIADQMSDDVPNIHPVETSSFSSSYYLSIVVSLGPAFAACSIPKVQSCQVHTVCRSDHRPISSRNDSR